ncbi:NAD(P)H:quinone oxidoreductase type IV [Aestuariivirga sp.]|uniref:NAD(P)H:quinone oxidoreductase type IV n=1 Tax=Aestuariivirga sp. TaxID=2650926 RepID=UPI003593BD15
MTKVLVLYYSAWGHMEQMSYAAAEGAREAGAEVEVKRVPELVPEEVAKAAWYKMDQKAPIAKPEELADYDAIIFACGTRYGTMAAQMRNFIDQTGGLWAKQALAGKVGSAMTSSATQHGGQESTILGFIPTMMHHGMVVVGLPYTYQGQMGVDEIRGGSPYGASTVTAGDGSRQPAQHELDGAKYQGKHVATIAAKLAAK